MSRRTGGRALIDERSVLRAVVVCAWLLGGVWLVLSPEDAAFLPAGAVALTSAATVALSDRLGIRVPPWADFFDESRYSFGTRVKAAGGVLLRALPWPLFAWQLGQDHERLPVLGDIPLVVQSLALVVGVLADMPRRSLVRSLRLGFDSVLASLGLTLALWVLVVGPAKDYDLVRVDVQLGLALCFALILQFVLVALIIVREPVTHGAEAVVATGLLVATEVAVVVTYFHGGRVLPRPFALAWLVGWVLMTRSILVNRRLADESLTADVTERREIRSTDLATGAVVLAVFVSVLGYLVHPGGRPMPGGLVGAALILFGVTVFAARESLLGRLRARMTTQLRHQAQIDPLTGLANRRGLTQRLRRIPPDAEWSVLALDLDGFKAVNDVHGHAAGDDVLVIVADVLRALCPPDGVAARTGGDEFAVLAPGDVTATRHLGVQIGGAVREQLATLGLGPRITVSVGVGRVDSGSATATDDGARSTPAGGPDRLTAIVEAAAALRAAKDLGRDRVQVYPGLVARQRERRLLLERRLRDALRTGDVVAVAQPIVDLATGRTVAVEALARWEDEELGHVPPAEFVLVAERSGLVADLGRCVLRSAVEQYRAHGLVGSGVRLAVNVSPLELRGPGYVDGLAAVLEAAGVPGRDLVVEVTEAVVIEAGDPSVRVLSRLNDLGVQVAIDDFGTGYSALGYLRRLPVQSMKVDRSLVAEALSSVRTRQIVAGVVDLARRLGLLVTLEGIEDVPAARLAHELGADLGQGYLLGRPQPWAQTADRVLRGRTTSGLPGTPAQGLVVDLTGSTDELAGGRSDGWSDGGWGDGGWVDGGWADGGWDGHAAAGT